jgi:hypothetical protein
MPTAPSAVAFSEKTHQHLNHPQNLHPAIGNNRRITSLFTIEVRCTFLHMIVKTCVFPWDFNHQKFELIRLFFATAHASAIGFIQRFARFSPGSSHPELKRRRFNECRHTHGR